VCATAGEYFRCSWRLWRPRKAASPAANPARSWLPPRPGQPGQADTPGDISGVETPRPDPHIEAWTEKFTRSSAMNSSASFPEGAVGRQPLALLSVLDVGPSAVTDIFRTHPDRAITSSFASLDQVTGARLLGAISDDRTRFTDARPLKAYARLRRPLLGRTSQPVQPLHRCLFLCLQPRPDLPGTGRTPRPDLRAGYHLRQRRLPPLSRGLRSPRTPAHRSKHRCATPPACIPATRRRSLRAGHICQAYSARDQQGQCLRPDISSPQGLLAAGRSEAEHI
jgi:hypothetical protein